MSSLSEELLLDIAQSTKAILPEVPISKAHTF